MEALEAEQAMHWSGAILKPNLIVSGSADGPVPRSTPSCGHFTSVGVSVLSEMSLQELRFGEWRLVPSARVLLRDELPVTIGSRAYDLLHLLLLRRGRIVTVREIISFVWPTTTVDDTNVRIQLSTLRKVLGEDRHLIKTIAGRGYLFCDELD
ncbi:winged helix-turn-helix domain-containing protein [Sphingomonas arvum]|uniref:winged helix-turn-helix domain-containing protein n=1 Tax=Sphingomonas arvum TaxID=2992113 RepID=UPI0038B3ED1A